MKINRILFIVLTLMVAVLVGCSGNSDSNPAADGGNGGLVNVSGRVANVADSARVSFYTPEAAMKKGFSGNFSARASMNGNGIYTVDTDKAGNYSVNLPEDTYYVVAEEGDKMTVPARKSFSARAAVTKVEDIVLTKTTDVNGDVLDAANNPVANVPVYIENTPFMCVSNASGHFTFNRIPQLDANGTYSIVAYTFLSGVRYSGSHSLTSAEQSGNTNVKLQLKEDSAGNSKKINGYVYYSGTTNPVANHNVMAVLATGQVYSTTSDTNGKYAFDIATDETTVELSADMITFTSFTLPSTSDALIYVNKNSSASNGTLLITEACDKDYDAAFRKSMNTFVILQKNGNVYEEYYNTALGTPVDGYAVSDMPEGTYCYAFVGESIAGSMMVGCKFTDDFTITSGNTTNVTAQHTVCFCKPSILINGEGYFAADVGGFGSSDSTADGCVSIEVYASDSDRNITKLSHDTIGKVVPGAAKIDFSELSGGEHKVWVELKFNVNGFEKTFKSDEYPYVKSVTAD